MSFRTKTCIFLAEKVKIDEYIGRYNVRKFDTIDQIYDKLELL